LLPKKWCLLAICLIFMTPINTPQRGLALLLTLITVSAIITITLSMVSLTMQQLQLSVDARDSERAFHAASGGLECAQFLRNNEADAFITYSSGAGPTLRCMEEVDNSPVVTDISPSGGGGGNITRFSYEIEPTLAGRSACIEMDINIMNAAANSDMTHNFGGRVGTVDCAQSSVCTVALSRGYNRSCSASTGTYEILRELNAIF